MYTTVFGKKSRVLRLKSESLQSLVFMSPSAHFALSHEVNVVDTVCQLGVLVNRNHVVSVVALHLPRAQQLLLLALGPGPRALLSVPQSLALSGPGLGHGPLPRQLQHAHLLLVHAAAVARVEAQRAVLQQDVGDAPSPAVEDGVDLAHRHVDARLQRAPAHRHADERQVSLHRAQLHKVVRVHAADGEVQRLQVEGVVEHGRHAPPVLVGQADDVGADAAVPDGELHPFAEDGADGGEELVVLRLRAPGALRSVDLAETLEFDESLELPLNFTLDAQQGLQNKDSAG